VNKNVTTPEGAAAAAADTPGESHNRHAHTSHIGGSGPVTGYECFSDEIPRAAYVVDFAVYIQLTGATKSVNRDLEAKTRALAGWKGYTTNLTTASPTFIIDAYHQLWHIEKSFRMSKHTTCRPDRSITTPVSPSKLI
jgi:hypothetical protein